MSLDASSLPLSPPPTPSFPPLPPPQEMFSSQSGFSLGKKPPAHLLAPSPDAEPPALTYLKGLLAWKLDDTQTVGGANV